MIGTLPFGTLGGPANGPASPAAAAGSSRGATPAVELALCCGVSSWNCWGNMELEVVGVTTGDCSGRRAITDGDHSNGACDGTPQRHPRRRQGAHMGHQVGT